MFKRYFHCILNAECYACLFHRRNWPNCTQNATIYSILTKIKRAFAPVGDISKFKRYFHHILDAECSARSFQRRNKHSSTQIVNIYSILTEIMRSSSPFGDISTFKHYFHFIFNAECYARLFQRRNRPNFKLNAPICGF